MIKFGDSPQFSTPEYIIQFITKFSASLKVKRILDPACGTGKMLNSVKNNFNHSVDCMGVEINNEVFSFARNNNPELKLYNANFFEISIKELGLFDLIVCNPPFGINSSDKAFGVNKNLIPIRTRSIESVFIFLSLKLLKSNGFLVFIVPEGFLVSDSNKIVRNFIINNYSLEAIVSLPLGIFKPYSGVKANILVLKNSKQRDEIFFAEYLQEESLKPIILNYFENKINKNLSQGFWVPKIEIESIPYWSYNYLKGINEYELIKKNSTFKIHALLDLFEIRKSKNEDEDSLLIPKIGKGREILLKSDLIDISKAKNYHQLFPKNEIVILAYVKTYLNSNTGKKQLNSLISGSYIPFLSLNSINEIFIELPPLKIQYEIVKTEQKIREISSRVSSVALSFSSNPFNYNEVGKFANNFDKADEKDISFESLLWPLATSYRIATKGSPNMNAQLDNYFKMFEMISAFNSIVLISSMPSDLVEKYSQDIWSDDKKIMARPSFGTWVGLYRRLINLYLKLNKQIPNFKISLPFDISFYLSLCNDNLFSIINKIPEIRNKYPHGGAIPEIVTYTEISKLTPMLISLFEMLLFYQSVRLIYPTSMKKKNGLYLIKIKKLDGTHYHFAEDEIESEVDMDTENLYLYDETNKKRVKLLPEFVKLAQCESCGNWSVFFYDKLDKNRVKYKSYQTEIHDHTDNIEGVLNQFL
jgi:tRNA G10  N-methylase Trm11